MFHVTQIPGKGKGVIALQFIPAGSELQVEKPLITVQRFNQKEHYAASILPQLQRLSDFEKREFFDLSNNFPGLRPIEGIVKTNAIPLGQPASTGGVFLACSRFNHACTANAAYHWNEVTRQEKIYAIHNINADEEITVNYLSDEEWVLPGKARRAHMLAEFGFSCCCTRCESTQGSAGSESDIRRKRLGDIQNAVGNGTLIVSNPAKALSMCREALDLLQKENEAGPRLIPVYYDAFQICVCHGDVARASRFVTLAAETAKKCQGDGAPDLKKMEALARKPESHPSAFVTRKWSSAKKNSADEPSEATDEWLWSRAG